MGWNKPTTGDTVAATDITQLINNLDGTAAVGEPIKITKVNSASEYALDVKNVDATYSYGLRVRDNAGNDVLKTSKTQIDAGLDIVMAAAKKVDGLELGTHDHSAGAGMGVQIDTAALANDAVKTGKIDDLAVHTSKINNFAVTAAKIETNTITTANIKNLNVTGAKMANATITVTQLANDAVETAKIKNLNVTAAKMANATITSTQLATNSVGSDAIAANAVGTSEIATNGVGSAEIAAGAVDTSELASNAVTTVKITNENVTAAKIANRTRRLFIPCATGYNLSTGVITRTVAYAIQMADAQVSSMYGHLCVPADYVAAGSFVITGVVNASGAGNMRSQLHATYAAENEVFNLHHEDTEEETTACGENTMELLNPLSMSGVVAGDLISLVFIRHGDDAADTIGQAATFVGFYLDYASDS